MPSGVRAMFVSSEDAPRCLDCDKYEVETIWTLCQDCFEHRQMIYRRHRYRAAQLVRFSRGKLPLVVCVLIDAFVHDLKP